MWKKVIEYKDVNPKSPTYGSLSSVSEVSLECFRPAPAPMWVLIGESCEYDEYGLRTGNMLREFQDENEMSPTYGQISSTTEPSEECEASTTDPVWVNTGENWCEQDSTGAYTGYLVIEQYDKNPFSPSYMETREIKELSEDCTASDKNPHWVTLQEQCVIVMVNCNLSFNGTASKFQIDDNPYSPTYNTTRMITEQSESCVPCGEEMYRWVEVQGEYICVGTTKCKKMKKQVSYDRGYSWEDVIPYEYQAGDAIETHSTDCGYVPPTPEPIYRWVDDGDNFICSGTTKCERLKKQVSYDSGTTWSDVEPAEYSAGTVIEYDSTDCGYVPDPIYRWVNDGNEFICSGTTKYQQEKKQVSLDSGSTWSDVSPKETRAGVVIEYDSPDCGYVPPMVIYKYEYVGDVCGSDERLEDAIEGVSGTVLVQDDYSCVGYDKYEKEEVVLDFSGIVYNTGEYVVGDLIEQNSEDCGYVPPLPSNVKARRILSNGLISDIPWNGSSVLTSGETNYIVAYSGETPYSFPVSSVVETIISNRVTEIGEYCFRYFSGMSSVTISDTVTSIGYEAFYRCSLTSLTIPNSVTYISTLAFENAGIIPNLTIPDSVTYIGQEAFDACGIVTLNIGSGLSGFSSSSFLPNAKLESITVSQYNPYYDSRDNCNGIIETSSNTLLVACKNTVIPETVEIIGEAFESCTGLTDIVIPSGVTSFIGNTFYGCGSLTSITSYSKVLNVDYTYMFYGVPRNGTLYFPLGSEGIYSQWLSSNQYYLGYYGWTGAYIGPGPSYKARLTLIGGVTSDIPVNGSYTLTSAETSSYKSSAVSADINIGIATIGTNAFSGFTKLSSVTIDDGITSIENRAFYDCSGLTSVTLGSGLTNIGNSAFTNCSSITSITIPSGVEYIRAFAFAHCSGITGGIDIPSSIIDIGSSAFQFCNSLNSITIPSVVRYIGSGTFFWCSSLSSITCYATTAPNLGDSVFYAVSSTGTLYVPSGSDYSTWLSQLPSGWTIQYI